MGITRSAQTAGPMLRSAVKKRALKAKQQGQRLKKKGSSEDLVALGEGEVAVAEEEEDADAVVGEGTKASGGGFELPDFGSW